MFSKTTTISVLCVSVIFCLVGVSFAKTNSLEKTKNSKREQTIKKLNKIIIDRIDFEDDNIDVAVKMLSKKSGMNIIYKRTPKDKNTQHLVDLVLVKRTLMEVIYYVCKATKLNYHIGENVVVISSAPNPIERKEEMDRRKRKSDLTKKKLKKIIVPNIDFTDANIHYVVQELKRLSKRYAPDNVGVAIIVGSEIKYPSEFPKITMKFKNISMDRILSCLHNNFGVEHRIEDGIVILYFSLSNDNSTNYSNQKPKNEKRKQTIKKLREIIVKRIDWEDITFSSAIKQLQKISKKHEIDIILKLSPKEKEKQFLIDFVMVKRSLMDVIYFFSMTTALHYHIGENEVVISSVPNPLEIKEYKQQREINNTLIIIDKLKSIQIPNVKFVNANIYDVALELNRLSESYDPDKSGIKILVGYEMEAIPEFPKITIDLRNISMGEILDHLCRNNGLKYRIERNAVTLFADHNKKTYTNKVPVDNTIRKKLQETIEYLEFKNTEVSKVTRTLSEKYGIRIILKHDEMADEPVVDLLLKKRNLYQAIYFLCKASGYYFRIGKDAVIISSIPFFESIEDAQRKKEQAKLRVKNGKKWRLLTEKKLKKIIFPEIKFNDADIFTVIRMLNRYGRRNDPNKKGIPVIAGFDMKTARALPKITMKYSSVSMYETLDKLCKYTGLKYKIEEGAVILSSHLSLKERRLLLVEAKVFNKPKINSALSASKLLSSPKLIMSVGREAMIRMTMDVPMKGVNKKILTGINMNVDSTVNGDIIELEGQLSIIGLPVVQKKEADIVAYLSKSKKIIYHLKIKEQDKLYKIVFEDEGEFFEIVIKVTFIDQDGVPIKKAFLGKLESEEFAVNSAKKWLILVDTEKYPESWKQASQLFKGAVTEKQWTGAVARARKPLGKNISRKLKSKRYFTSLPGAPDGKYFVIQFKASFKNKKSAIETITTMLDKDGQWRVSGYFIK